MWSPAPRPEKENQGDDLSKMGIDDCCLDKESVCEIEKAKALELEEKRGKLRTTWLGERNINKKVKCKATVFV